jgi:DNA-binding response OmpR family regulator/cation transporter-like permease
MISSSDILNGKILVVDDQEANVRLLEGMLRVAGYTSVESTTDPNAVCELHRKNRYGLILLDLRMPGMDGFQVMEGLKEIEEDGYLPVLVITAQPDEKLRALKAGAKDFVSKPFDLAEVLARVHNMLEVRLLHGETKNYSKALERTVLEVEASREQIRSQGDEVKSLYDKLVAEHKRLIELSAQPGAMVGVKKDERLVTPWLRSLKLRLPWLQLNLVAAFVAAGVIGLFQETIDRLLILTMFLPVLAGQSGNTGSQALAVTLRGVFLGELGLVKERALIMKEALLGLLNGALVGLVAAFCMYVVAAVKHMSNAFMLSVVVFLAMISSCVISGALGAVMPLILKKLGADPVIASSIFLTTGTNVASMGLLLGLATLLVK